MAAEIAAELDDEWAGVVLGTELGSLTYSSPEYNIQGTTLSDRALSAFVHLGFTPDRRLTDFYLSNLLGNPVETTVAVAHLVFANVINRYPKLNIVLAHGGGCIAALCGRWQRGCGTIRPGVPGDIEAPADALRRFYVDTIVHSSTFLSTVIDVVGDDKLVLGSDWPIPMGTAASIDDIGHLGESLRRKIRVDNAIAAFGKRLTFESI